MARSSRVDPCLFCGAAPCECNKPAKKTPAKRQARVKPVSDTPAPEPVIEAVPVRPVKIDAFAAMRAQAKPIEQPTDNQAVPLVVDGSRELPAPSEKADWETAVRALAPILHPTERAKYAYIISAQPTIAERREAWRTRFHSTASSR